VSDSKLAPASAATSKSSAIVPQQVAHDGRPYLMDARFTATDIHLVAVRGWCSFLNVALSRRPVLAAHVGRIAGPPAAG